MPHNATEPGRGRVFDNIFVERLWRNVKYEVVYLRGYATIGELLVGLSQYFAFYNGERPHQSLGNKTPDEVYRTATGGDAMIVDKFARNSNSKNKDKGKTGAAPSSC